MHTVIPATCEVKAQEENQSTYRGRDSHTVQSSAVATVVLQPAKCTHEPQQLKLVTLEMQCFITSLTVSHKQLWCTRTHEGCSDTENLLCGVTLYSTNLPRGTLHTLMLFVIAKCKENGSLCYLMLRSRHRCP